MKEVTGYLDSMINDLFTGKNIVSFSVDDKYAFDDLKSLNPEDRLRITVCKYREKRSLNANGLFWHCIGEIASTLKSDKWEIYLQLLKRYGKYTYILVKPYAVEAVKSQWRESEVVGSYDANGKKAVQMICYFGSSTYNSKEFSVLLDGTISEMREMGLDTPLDEDVKRIIEAWENQ